MRNLISNLKNKLKFLVYFIAFYSNAQIPIIPLENYNYGSINNAYYKDVNHVYDSFEGTWLYQNGTTSITMKLIKRDSMLISNHVPYYEDFLLGEIKFVENGVEKLNTLNNLLTNHNYFADYNLYSAGILQNDMFPPCINCPQNTKRVCLLVDEPNNDDIGLSAIMALQKGQQNNLEVIQMRFIKKEDAKNMNKNDLNSPSLFRNFTIPYGEYILIKQP